jgi:protein-S-isoprenylcysteine O-methyltransferase Ste14
MINKGAEMSSSKYIKGGMISLSFRSLVGIIFQIALFAALMLLPFGSIDWPAAIIWLKIYAVITLSSGIFLVVARPQAVEARFRAGRDAQPAADRMALIFMCAGLSVPIIVAALDISNWQFFEQANIFLRITGLAVFILGFSVIVLSMLSNEFAAPTVHIQEDAEHSLADAGVYAYLRHPMYCGFLLFMMGTTLWLGSIAATVLAGVMVASAAIYRIGIEETMLEVELPGYKDYKNRVKTRFIPFVY